jgi:hypothetical protein
MDGLFVEMHTMSVRVIITSQKAATRDMAQTEQATTIQPRAWNLIPLNGTGTCAMEATEGCVVNDNNTNNSNRPSTSPSIQVHLSISICAYIPLCSKEDGYISIIPLIHHRILYLRKAILGWNVASRHRRAPLST